VADTGIGIDPEHHEQIFEKFFRVDDTMHHSTGKTKFKGAGPGLGLSLVKGIIKGHKGRVWVESPGCDETRYPGSKFFLVIPIEEVKEPEAPPPQKQSQIETRHWRRSEAERKADQEADKPHTKKRVA
jgi:signal transduction histidine kinase